MNKINKAVMTKKLSCIFAVAAGLAIGNLYWAQPLLANIAESFSVSKTDTSILITATQVGYAVGILLIVPLGDLVQRSKLIPVVMGLSSAALFCCAFSPNLNALCFSLAGMGLTTVTGQIILPLTGDMADEEHRGEYVGIVSSGIMTGILAARTVSGIIANYLGWRAIFIIAGLMDIVILCIMARCIPICKKNTAVSYPNSIAKVFTSVVKVPTLFRIMLMNGFGFLAFNMFWTALTFLLSGEPFEYTTFQIGLVSLAGLGAAVASQNVGKLMDRGLSMPATGMFFGFILLSGVLMLFVSKSLIMVIICAGVMSLGSQGTGILNQTRVFSLEPENRSRLNTAYVVNNFIYGAIGSSLTSKLWVAGGWQAVSFGIIAASIISIVIWALSRNALKK